MRRVTIEQCASAASVACAAFVVLCAVSAPTTAAVNVLAIEPLPARSHWTFMRSVVMAMATGGHNVTVYTPFASSSAATAGVCDGGPVGCGYAEIPLRLGVPDKVALDVRTAVADFADQWRFVGIAVDKSRTACDRLDRMAATGRFSGVRYDMVVVELVSSECTSRVSGALGDDVPLVYVFPSPMASWVEAKALGTGPGPSYAARLFARYAAPDTFARRLENVYGWTVMAALQWLHERGDDQTAYRKPSVTFVNTDPVVEKSVPAVQNMIGVGGVHLPPLEPICPACRPPWCRLAAVCLLMVAISGRPRPVDAVRVLAFETVAAKSHWNFMRAVLHALATRGHPVKVYTPFPDLGAPTTDNYTEVKTSAEYQIDGANGSATAVNLDASVVVPLFARPSFMVPFIVNSSRSMCDDMDRVLSRDVGAYDLFVTEPLSSECVSHAARRLGVPLVYVVPAPLLPWIETGAFGHYSNPAVATHLFAAYAVPDTLYRRLHSAALHLYTVCGNYWYTAVAERRPYDLAPPVRPALVFVNTHHVTEPPRPVPANRVDVGGIHLTAPRPLPADILKFIEESQNGVIYFSFGTVVALSTLPDYIQNAFKDALAEVTQRVLLKFEGEMKDKPKNVMTSKWLPQRDILKHPNVKLFIGHGGISGVYEAVDAGVPILGFPLFYDQPRNMANLVDAGMALSLDLFSVTKNTLLNAINEMINNETYSKNAKIVSDRFKDRPMSPTESVVYWTEYVIRHKGAPHLKSHAFNLTWYQYFLLDVIAVVFLIILSVSYITLKTLRLVKKIIFKPLSKSKLKPD